MGRKIDLGNGCGRWLCIVALFWVWMQTPWALSQERPENVASEPEAYLLKAIGQTMSCECVKAFAPELAVIEGQVSAETLEATEAAEKLRSIIDSINVYVEKKEGEVRLLETVRTVRPADLKTVGEKEGAQPFRIVRRFEVRVSSHANLDEILDSLYLLGMEPPEYEGRPPGGDQRYPAVGFCFSDMKAPLEELMEKCRKKAVRVWCETNAPARETDVCVSVVDKIRAILQNPVLFGPFHRFPANLGKREMAKQCPAFFVSVRRNRRRQENSCRRRSRFARGNRFLAARFSMKTDSTKKRLLACLKRHSCSQKPRRLILLKSKPDHRLQLPNGLLRKNNGCGNHMDLASDFIGALAVDAHFQHAGDFRCRDGQILWQFGAAFCGTRGA